MNRNFRTPVVYAAAILVVYWIVLFTLTHIPGRAIQAGGFTVNDKVAHFSAYALLAFLAVWVLPWATGAPRWWGSWVFGLLAVYGALDEWLQSYVPRRQADVLDWVADLCGVTAGIGLFYLVRTIYRGVKSRATADDSQAD